jgi:hypothetical protein
VKIGRRRFIRNIATVSVVTGGLLPFFNNCSKFESALVADGTQDQNSNLPESSQDPVNPILSGQTPPPAWASSVPLNAWHVFPNSAFTPWANSNIPHGNYNGTNPFESIINAYCDPAYSSKENAQYFYGGGHGDGTCNAVVKFDHSTLTWSLVGLPTPPSRYPPSYSNGGSSQPGPLNYPSGKSESKGFFLSADEISDPMDLPYANPLARASTHMYGAAAMRGSTVHYFYSTYAEFDTLKGTWSGRGVNLGTQLALVNPNYGSVPLQTGTVAIYDEKTDRFFVTFNPGDSGGGWRNGLIQFNPITRLIENIFICSNYGYMADSASVVIVGRDIFIFNKVGTSYSAPLAMNQGMIFNMDSKTYKAFVVTGDTEGTIYRNSPSQETIPACYDGRFIRRWNYQTNFRSDIYSIDPKPVSGEGTLANPLVFNQTKSVLSGTPPANVAYIYTRMIYNSSADCIMMIPISNSNWYGFKLT